MVQYNINKKMILSPKKIILTFFIITNCFLIDKLYATDVYKSNWGDSIPLVIKKERGKKIKKKSDDYLEYKHKILNYPVISIFRFEVDDKRLEYLLNRIVKLKLSDKQSRRLLNRNLVLDSVTTELESPPENPEKIKAIYSKFLKLFQSKYGEGYYSELQYTENNQEVFKSNILFTSNKTRIKVAIDKNYMFEPEKIIDTVKIRFDKRNTDINFNTVNSHDTVRKTGYLNQYNIEWNYTPVDVLRNEKGRKYLYKIKNQSIIFMNMLNGYLVESQYYFNNDNNKLEYVTVKFDESLTFHEENACYDFLKKKLDKQIGVGKESNRRIKQYSSNLYKRPIERDIYKTIYTDDKSVVVLEIYDTESNNSGFPSFRTRIWLEMNIYEKDYYNKLTPPPKTVPIQSLVLTDK